ncbi:MAG: VTT domain-containing protein [Desulfamplus sp.]|nr:VTT domain-containing protein [Desulfamplus sp.]
MEIVHDLLWLLKPEGITWLITVGGLPAICFVIFAETGFFALLPGDSLLVLCGIFAATTSPEGEALLPISFLLTILPLFGILGDQVGFWLGKLFGQAMYNWKDKSVLGVPIFKVAYLKKTENFYKRWGVFSIVMGRWVPIVRTFAPIVAGITKMPLKKFITFNILGAFLWVWSMVLTGYLLGNIAKTKFNFDLVKHIDKIAIVIIIISLIPIFYTVWKEKQENRILEKIEK